LKQQREGKKGSGQIRDLWTTLTQVLSNQIKIAHQAAILVPQVDVDTSVLERPKNSARQLWVREESQDRCVIDIGVCFRWARRLRCCGNVSQVAIESEGVASFSVCRVVCFVDRIVCSAQ